eukprot:scaffold531_cov30-Attheya_sp.AAC.1
MGISDSIKKTSTPISTFRWFISVLRSMAGKNPIYIRVDEGGELANSTDFCKAVVGLDLILETTGGYASNLNGKNESMNDNAKGMVRTFLQARSHSDDKWCFAFCYAIWIIRRILNTRVKMTPYEKWHDIKPSFKGLTVFGCHVYIVHATVTQKALDSRTQTDLRDVVTNSNIDGYFMGYSNTTKVILYWDPTTNKIERTHHCFLDEFDTKVSPNQKHNPGALLLAECATGHQHFVPPNEADIQFQSREAISYPNMPGIAGGSTWSRARKTRLSTLPMGKYFETTHWTGISCVRLHSLTLRTGTCRGLGAPARTGTEHYSYHPSGPPTLKGVCAHPDSKGALPYPTYLRGKVIRLKYAPMGAQAPTCEL